MAVRISRAAVARIISTALEGIQTSASIRAVHPGEPEPEPLPPRGIVSLAGLKLQRQPRHDVRSTDVGMLEVQLVVVVPWDTSQSGAASGGVYAIQTAVDHVEHAFDLATLTDADGHRVIVHAVDSEPVEGGENVEAAIVRVRARAERTAGETIADFLPPAP